MVRGPPDWSSDFFLKLGASGPAAFGTVFLVGASHGSLAQDSKLCTVYSHKIACFGSSVFCPTVDQPRGFFKKTAGLIWFGLGLIAWGASDVIKKNAIKSKF